MNRPYIVFSAWTLLKICWTVLTGVLITLSRLDDRLLAVVSESRQTDAKHKATFDWLESFTFSHLMIRTLGVYCP